MRRRWSVPPQIGEKGMEKLLELGEYEVWTSERGDLNLIRKDPLQDKESMILLTGDTRYFVKSLIWHYKNKK